MIGPDGNDAYFISCNGALRSLSSCFKKAGDVCPNGYKRIDNEDGKNLFGGNSIRKGIFVECKQ